ncbi:hypothetical protein [Profundibacter sp.]|uniref:hypothetical protein n=1 Tax=Profundibacter sp. TaxID=3101071 RepID=UPI003D134761
MKQIAAITIAACLALSPAYAENSDEGGMDEGLSLMEQGARMLLRGLATEMEPALKDLKGLAEEMGPGLAELQGLIGDFTNYHAPEVLPNGDIIIRRKTPLEIEKPLEEGEIEL